MFAINNNEDVDFASGGTHWSLLVYRRDYNCFEHYDSMDGMNLRIAKKCVSIIKPFICSDVSSAKFEEPWTPQQENGYDCGVYVMAIAQTLCKAYVDGIKSSSECTSLLRDCVTPNTVSDMRHSIWELILSLSKEQGRS